MRGRVLMKLFMKRFLLVVAGIGVMLMTSCDTREAKKTTVPAPQALAPTIQQTPATPPPPPPQAQVPAPQPPKPDPVAGLIADAEKAYQTGMTDYIHGHLDAAKQDFNHAVDILM